MPRAAHRPDCLEGPPAAGARQSRPGSERECPRSAYFAPARQNRRRCDDPQPARSGLSPGGEPFTVNASISRQLILWLAVPLTLLALPGVLVHYFNNLAPQVISADQRLKQASAEIVAALQDGTTDRKS